jgi:hypothetical protein
MLHKRGIVQVRDTSLAILFLLLVFVGSLFYVNEHSFPAIWLSNYAAHLILIYRTTTTTTTMARQAPCAYVCFERPASFDC